MNILQMSVLIRTLIVLAMIAIMVIAGALTARRRRAANPDPVVRSARQLGPPAVLDGGAARSGLESNDSDFSAPGTRRRAA